MEQRIEHPVGPLELAAGKLTHPLQECVAVALALGQDRQHERRRRGRDQILVDVHTRLPMARSMMHSSARYRKPQPRPDLAFGAVDVLDWLLEGDPAIRWQVLRDLTDASPDEVDAERARVEHEGWGARLLAAEGADGLWAGGACFPAAYTGGEPGQPWTATMHTLQTLQILGLDPASEAARRAIALVAEHGRWEHEGQRYFDGEVEPCINGRTIETGAYFGVDVAAIVERILGERLADGGWNCEAENGSVRSSFHTTIDVLDGLLEFERGDRRLRRRERGPSQR